MKRDNDEMRTLFESAQKATNPKEIFNEGKEYKRGYGLDPDQIRAGALICIQEKMAKKGKNINLAGTANLCEIVDISLEHNMDVKDTYDILLAEPLKNALNSKKPLFIIITANHHHVLAAFTPDKQVLHTNSKSNSKEGLQFVKDLQSHIKFNPIQNISTNQQIDNCCGLAVADNIAKLVVGEKLINFDKDTSKQLYYSELGQKVFNKILQKDIDFNKKAEHTEHYQNQYQKGDISTRGSHDEKINKSDGMYTPRWPT